MFPFQQQMPKDSALRNLFSQVNVKDFSQSKKGISFYNHSLIGTVIILRTTQSSYCSWNCVRKPSHKQWCTSWACLPGQKTPAGRAKFCLSLQMPTSLCAAWAGTSCPTVPEITAVTLQVTPRGCWHFLRWKQQQGSHTCLPPVFVKQQ